jgi:spore maturation protein SpmA
VITCLVTNWGITVSLGLLLTMSEWLAKTKRFEENGILDLINHFLKIVLKHKGDQK